MSATRLFMARSVLESQSESHLEHADQIIVRIFRGVDDELEARGELNVRSDLDAVERFGNVLVAQRTVLGLAPRDPHTKEVVCAAEWVLDADTS